MSVFDVFKLKKIKAELESLKRENESLHSILTPEHQEIYDLTLRISSLNIEKEKIINDIEYQKDEYENKKSDISNSLFRLNSQAEQKKKELLVLDEQLMLESFSLYERQYEFIDSVAFKEALESIRDRQKSMIKNSTACTGNQNWTVNNSQSEGRKMVNDMIKLVLRSFNNECDSCVSNVKFNNIHTFEKRIKAAFEALNKLGRIMQVSISNDYLRLKFSELYLAHEYQLKKQEEKEEQKQIREQMREEARLQREVEEARKVVEKERRHYSNALEKALKQLESCKNDDDRTLILSKIDELQNNLEEIEQQLKDIDYREANQKAGYVYVISNIGSFGEGVYKIGMTRRLEPLDRVSELGDASVPFNFDIHAMIFSENAPGLEAALHREFENKRLNKINKRREYFKVTLDEIESVITKNHDKTVEFIRIAEAEEYRESKLLNKEKSLVITELTQSWEEAAVSKE
ncbi:DUF4041 domain-containing protein [Paenibacillus arenosi]|uniref:DUF4041 domain-containing protein n=1 Tax=Paenibacillus arenosi TaxID=2774142 RepID=A0ABR9B0N3_9BACL|nr:DUF4041 domain-containing protein [Paenibacillus arenosi]MBD8499889.1 DUF4041 domain-containing protein [Paenibacillus arenosi]